MSIEFTHANVVKAIHRSQHCQRNWDLSREIPKEDIDLIAEAATQCPSKQNISYYRLQFITNRSVIEQIYELTQGAIMDPQKMGPVGGYPPRGRSYTNPQTLANLLIIYERKSLDEIDSGEFGPPRNAETFKKSQGQIDEGVVFSIEREATMAMGISAGYVNFISNMLGYATGCCQCGDLDGIRDVLGMRNKPALLMGVGYRNEKMNRKIHHADHTISFGSFKKQPMDVKFVD